MATCSVPLLRSKAVSKVSHIPFVPIPESVAVSLASPYHKNYHSLKGSFPEPHGSWGGADIRFVGPQPDTSRSCKTMNTELVCRTVCLFTPQLTLQYQIILFGDRGTCVQTTCPRWDATVQWLGSNPRSPVASPTP